MHCPSPPGVVRIRVNVKHAFPFLTLTFALKFLKQIFFKFNVYEVLPVCITLVPGALGDQERLSDLLELELNSVSCSAGAGTPNLDLLEEQQML